MKKHIIASVPRAEKSTASEWNAKKLGCRHISMDSIIAGLERVFPETGIDTEAEVDTTVNLQRISAKIAPFIRAVMDSGEYDERDYGMVIDVYQLLPEDYVRYIDAEVCSIHYFITLDVAPEEQYELLKRHDTPRDYTFYQSDEEKSRDGKGLVELSKYIKEQCVLHQLPYCIKKTTGWASGSKKPMAMNKKPCQRKVRSANSTENLAGRTFITGMNDICSLA